MDPGHRSPFIDLFLRGGGGRDVRLLAARGLLPRPARERIALLVVLSDDPDPEVARHANATIGRLPAEALADFLAADAPPALRAFFAARSQAAREDVALPDDLPLDAAAAPGHAEPDDAGREPATLEGLDLAAPEGQAPSEAVLEAEPSDAAPDGPAADDGPPDGAPEDHRLMSSLAVAERLKLASKGTREQRGQLIRDANRIVATAVLSSPKLSESEVESFAKMGNVSDDVLRIIGTNRTWLKNYGIVHALTRNPKTPPAISLHLMHRLTEKDIKTLTTDRNVPELLRLAARRILSKDKHG